MRRFISVVTALFASCALTPLPAQTVLIPGPDTITMARGDRRALACDAFDTRGHYVSRATCRLTVEHGLDARGDTLIAGAPDSLYLVRATWLRSDGGRPSDSVWVRVIETPSLPPVVVPPPDTTSALGYQLVASPIDTTLAVGASLQYRVQEVFDSGRTPYTYPSSGSSVLRFSVTNPAVASIDQTGRVTALAPGTTGVLIEKTNRGLSFMATLLVTGVAPQPPPIDTSSPPPTVGLPNLPLVLERALDGWPDSKFKVTNVGVPSSDPTYKNKLLRANGWDSYEVDNPGGLTVGVLDPVEGRPAAEFLFKAGHRAGTGAGIIQQLPSAPVKLTHSVFSFEVMLWKWQGNQSGTNKMGFLGAGNGGTNSLFLDAHGVGDNPLHLTFALQGVTHHELGFAPRPPGSSGLAAALMAKTFQAYPPTVPSVVNVEWKTLASAVMARDVWHRVDWEIRHNTPGIADGYVRLFLNGVLVVHIWNLDLTRNGAAYTNLIHWRPILGGGGASNTRDMALYFRNFRLSGR